MPKRKEAKPGTEMSVSFTLTLPDHITRRFAFFGPPPYISSGMRVPLVYAEMQG